MTSEFEKGVDKVSQEVSKAADDVKETMNEVGGRWKKSSLEEKITTIIGIVLFARGLRYLRKFIRGILLLILGGLLFSGYFNKGLKSLINYFKSSEKKAEKKVKKEVEKAEKKVKGEDKKPTKKK